MTVVAVRRVALCVDDVHPERAGSLDIGTRLATALSSTGVDAFVVSRERWHLVDEADVFVGLTPDVDPSLAPSNAWTVAWVHDRPGQWGARRELVAWDQVLAASGPASTRLRRRTPRAAGVLPLGVDTGVPPSDDVPELVVIERGPVELCDGLIPARLLEVAVGGALPVLRGSLGLRELGLEAVPVFRDDAELSGLLSDLEADPGGVADRLARLQRVVRERHSWTHRAEQFRELVAVARTTDDGSPVRTALHFFPDFSAGNPFQSMLYADLAEVAAHAAPVDDLVDHLHRRAEAAGPPGVLHLHWTSPILHGAVDRAEAQVALDRFGQALAAFQRRGGRLAWTVHNVLPHEEQHHDEEVELARLLTERADLIHVLSEVTFDEVAGLYDLDSAKVTVVPHSSYAGQYPDWVTPAAARARLGIMPAEKVLLALGGVRPYKGLDLLLDVFEQLVETDPTLRLLVAGKAGSHPAIDRLRERCEGHLRILSCFEHVPDDQLQVWMRAADLAVLPYRRILNSGAYLLAQTFGLPVVAPRDGALRAEDGPDHVRLFDPADPGSLGRVLSLAVDDLIADPARAAAAASAARSEALQRSPAAMAGAFAAAVAPLLTP